MWLGSLSLEKSESWLDYPMHDSIQRWQPFKERYMRRLLGWKCRSVSIVLEKQLKLKAAVHKTTKLINLAHATKQSQQASYAVLFLALKRSILEHLWNSFFFRRNERNILVKLLQEFTRVKTSFIELLKLQYETVNKARQQKLYKRTKI